VALMGLTADCGIQGKAVADAFVVPDIQAGVF
jgi:hypothetical protein